MEVATERSRLFTGPTPYRAGSPWTPFAAILAAIVATLLPQILLLAALGFFPSGGPDGLSLSDDELFRLNTPYGIAFGIFGQLGAIALIWLAASYRNRRREVLQLEQPRPAWSTLFLGGLIVAAATGIVELALYLTTQFNLRADSASLIEGLIGPYWWGVILMAVVLAPLWEELVYRGFLLSALASTRLGFWGGALVSNVMWTALHLEYSWQGLASVFTAGLVLSWLLLRTGSIWAPIAGHTIANTFAVAFLSYLGATQ